MALKTDDYMEMGRKHARGEWNGSPINPESWQGRAFQAGYEAEKERLRTSKVLQQTPLTRQVVAQQAHWPQAAREHARVLCVEAASCLNTPRMSRLMRSVDRLYRRYGNTPKHHDFPMSTQPCPEGPVTLGMLLRGE